MGPTLSSRAKSHLCTSSLTTGVGLALLISSLAAMGVKVESDAEGIILLLGLCSSLLPSEFMAVLTDNGICAWSSVQNNPYLWRCPRGLVEFASYVPVPVLPGTGGTLPHIPTSATAGEATTFADQLVDSVASVTIVTAVGTLIVGAMGVFGAWRGMKVLLAVQLPLLIILSLAHLLTLGAPLNAAILVSESCDCLESLVNGRDTVSTEAVCSAFPSALYAAASFASIAGGVTLAASITFCCLACDSTPMRGHPKTPAVGLVVSKYVHTRNPLDVMEANSSGL